MDSTTLRTPLILNLSKDAHHERVGVRPERSELCEQSRMGTNAKIHLFLKTNYIIKIVALSWLYALCSQIAIPLPFNLVPLSLQPLPLLLCAYFFETIAVHAYLLYLLQGAAGLPFFSHFRGGLMHLAGPTGGYLCGFLLAMMFIALLKSKAQKSILTLSIMGLAAGVIYFSAGLFQLSFFISSEKLLHAGLFPFIIGDSIKLFIWLGFVYNAQKK